MDLVRDVLDKRVEDRHGREIGRVDRIVLEVGDEEPPMVTSLEIGPAALADRIGPRLGRWVAAMEQALDVAAGRPLRVPASAVLSIHQVVRVDLAAGQTAAMAIERRLRRWIGAIPGA